MVAAAVIGRRSDGADWLLPAPGAGLPHALVSGVTGSGKSSIVQAVLGAFADDPGLAIVGVDLKGGAELGPWSPRFTDLVTTAEGATGLLLDLAHLVQCRADRLLLLGARSWVPELGPRLLVVIDELAEIRSVDPSSLVGEVGDVSALSKAVKEQQQLGVFRLELLASVARLSRAVGVSLICATQYPLAEIVPSGLRSQLTLRVAGRLTGKEQISVALGAGFAEGVAPDSIGATDPGTCFVVGVAGFPNPVKCRAFHVTDERLAARVAATAGCRVDESDLWPAASEPLRSVA